MHQSARIKHKHNLSIWSRLLCGATIFTALLFGQEATDQTMGFVLIKTNANCVVKIDGDQTLNVSASQMKKISLAQGEHLVEARPSDERGSGSWSKVQMLINANIPHRNCLDRADGRDANYCSAVVRSLISWNT
jgi:hypothetical protein